MKKLFSTVLGLLIGVFLYSQTSLEENLPEFSRAYLFASITYTDYESDDEETKVSHFEGANAFTFNVDGNSVLYYPHSGPVERFIYIGPTDDGEDNEGNTYQLIKTIEIESSKIVYFQLYDDTDLGLRLIYEESLLIVHFYNNF